LSRKGKALCERPLALQQNIDVAPRTISVDAHVKRSWVHFNERLPMTGTQYCWTGLQHVDATQNVSQINYDCWKASKSVNSIFW